MLIDINRVYQQKAEYDRLKMEWSCFGTAFKQWPHSVSNKYWKLFWNVVQTMATFRDREIR